MRTVRRDCDAEADDAHDVHRLRLLLLHALAQRARRRGVSNARHPGHGSRRDASDAARREVRCVRARASVRDTGRRAGGVCRRRRRRDRRTGAHPEDGARIDGCGHERLEHLDERHAEVGVRRVAEPERAGEERAWRSAMAGRGTRVLSPACCLRCTPRRAPRGAVSTRTDGQHAAQEELPCHVHARNRPGAHLRRAKTEASGRSKSCLAAPLGGPGSRHRARRTHDAPALLIRSCRRPCATWSV